VATANFIAHRQCANRVSYSAKAAEQNSSLSSGPSSVQWPFAPLIANLQKAMPTFGLQLRPR
jgi:hypothetical protein